MHAHVPPSRQITIIDIDINLNIYDSNAYLRHRNFDQQKVSQVFVFESS